MHKKSFLNGFQIKNFPIPPDDFDVSKASAKELERHGLPQCPDAKTSPELHQTWKRIFSRKLKFIKPILKPRRNVSRQIVRKSLAQLGNTNNNIWAGSVVDVDPKYRVFPYNVAGTWLVPIASIPSDDSKTDAFNSSMWVGIDGYNGTDVFQAGTEQYISRKGGASYSGWFEWYESSDSKGTLSKTFSNFPVRPGDLITCWLLMLSPTGGVIFLINEFKNSVVVTGLTVPKGSPGLVGDCIEWILERPSFLDSKGNPTPYSLPQLTETFFTFGSAMTSSFGNFSINDGTLLSMIENRKTVSTAALNGITLVTSV